MKATSILLGAACGFKAWARPDYGRLTALERNQDFVGKENVLVPKLVKGRVAETSP